MKTIFNNNSKPWEQVGAHVRQQGFRLTRSRQAVIRALFEAERWLSPEELLDRAARYWSKLGLVTVYRTLSVLSELGFVRRVHLEDRCVGYARSELTHGHHLVCDSCQQAVEFPGTEDLDPLIERVARRTGFVVTDHMLELVGTCPQCQLEPQG